MLAKECLVPSFNQAGKESALSEAARFVFRRIAIFYNRSTA